MKKTSSLLSVLLTFTLAYLLAPGMVRAKTLHDVTLPDTKTVDVAGKKTPMILNGMSLREVTVIGIDIKVYVLGLYLEKKTHKAEDVMNPKNTKYIDCVFVRHVSSSDIYSHWRDDIKDHLEGKDEHLDESLKALKGIFPAVANKDDLSYLFNGKTVTVLHNDKSLGTVTDPAVSQAMLATWFGQKPVSERIKKELLDN